LSQIIRYWSQIMIRVAFKAVVSESVAHHFTIAAQTVNADPYCHQPVNYFQDRACEKGPNIPQFMDTYLTDSGLTAAELRSSTAY